MRKYFVIILVGLIILAQPLMARAGCCKRIHWGDLGLDRIDVFNFASQSECLKTCKDLSSFATTKYCQNFYNEDAEVFGKRCKSASSGCCQINFTPDDSISYSEGKRAYAANSEVECSVYCKDLVSCSSSFKKGQIPNALNNYCTDDPSLSKPSESLPGKDTKGPVFKVGDYEFTTPTDPLKYAGYNPAKVVAKIINGLLLILGTIALLMFIYAGFLWMTDVGSGANIKRARSILVWSSAGLVLIFVAYIAVGYLLETFTAI